MECHQEECFMILMVEGIVANHSVAQSKWSFEWFCLFVSPFSTLCLQSSSFEYSFSPLPVYELNSNISFRVFSWFLCVIYLYHFFILLEALLDTHYRLIVDTLQFLRVPANFNQSKATYPPRALPASLRSSPSVLQNPSRSGHLSCLHWYETLFSF